MGETRSNQVILEHIETRLDQLLKGQTELVDVVLILGRKVEILTEIEIDVQRAIDELDEMIEELEGEVKA